MVDHQGKGDTQEPSAEPTVPLEPGPEERPHHALEQHRQGGHVHHHRHRRQTHESEAQDKGQGPEPHLEERRHRAHSRWNLHPLVGGEERGERGRNASRDQGQREEQDGGGGVAGQVEDRSPDEDEGKDDRCQPRQEEQPQEGRSGEEAIALGRVFGHLSSEKGVEPEV